jgi:hypothetical protein
VICTVYGNDTVKVQKAADELKAAIEITATEPDKPLLIKAEVYFDEKVNSAVVNNYFNC